MYFSTVAAFAALVLGSLAYNPFSIYPLSTHQPNGNPDGQVNYYHLSLTVTSPNSGSSESGTCDLTWSDNPWTDPDRFSTYVPTGGWIACNPSTFSVQLYPYFTIGNYSVSVQQNFTDPHNGTQMLASGTIQVVNNTADWTCQINPTIVPYSQHASGDCSIPPGEPAKSMKISSANPAPAPCHATNVNTTFLVDADTNTTQSIFVVGSKPELGNWDPAHAIPLDSAENDGSVAWPPWIGAVDLSAGTSFEYKYLMRDADETLTWECCENRDYQVPTGTCGSVTAGNNPDMFRG